MKLDSCFNLKICLLCLCISQSLGFPFDTLKKDSTCDAWSCGNDVGWSPIHRRGYFMDMSCHCDEYCRIMDDCCSDYNSSSNNDKLKQFDYMKHFSICADDIAVSVDNGFLAVTKCPEDWSLKNITFLCESSNSSDVMLRLPVSGQSNGVVYRNVYCASCHGEAYIFWGLSVDCGSKRPLDLDSNSTLEEILANRYCHLKLFPPKSMTYRPCMSNVIKHCAYDFNATSVIDLCQSEGMKLVYAKEKVFFNNHCAMCNNANVSCYNSLPRQHGTRSRVFYSFSLLLDLNTKSGSTRVGGRTRKIAREVNITHTCTEHQVFDPFIQECRDLYGFHNSRSRTLSDMTDVNSSIHDFIECPRIKLNKQEFSILENGSLQTVYGEVYGSSEFYNDTTNAYVCTNLKQNYTETTTFYDTKIEFNFSLSSAITTTVGLLLSQLGLLVTMTTYFIFKTLRNIPGKIILSLTSALFFAELLLLFAPRVERYSILCKTFAILMHYLFLEAFLWMNVMACDVWYTFSKSFVKAGDGGKSSRRFCFYNVYVRSISVTIVAAGVTVDQLLPNSLYTPNYGEGLCWFTNKRGLLVFFAAPLFLIVLMNIFFFSVAAGNIYKAKRKSAIYLAKHDNVQFSIYVKLALVMGLTWAFGFLASLFPLTAVWYIYIFFNTLQGLFICIGFVFTKKVLSLFREKFTRLRRRPIGSDQMPSTPTRTTELTFKDRVR